MSKWIMIFAAGLLVLAASCGANPTVQPTTAPAATQAPTTVATLAPTLAATATSEPATATVTSAATDTPAPTIASTPEGDATQAQGDFAPKVRSVWNTTVGQDEMTGACPKG